MNRDLLRLNRHHLHAVPSWITEDEWRRSHYGYGCPGTVFHLLNLPINMQVTYTDLIVSIAGRMKNPVRYLELGVSVGKNFYVISRVLENALIYGVDWEAMNPSLEAVLVHHGSRHPALRPAVKEFSLGSNRISYIQGDEFDLATWRNLEGHQFNLLFSDAFHTPDALTFELNQLMTLGLIAEDGFCMIWDDLDAKDMEAAFWHLADVLRQRYRANQSFSCSVNGWLGQHEHQHKIGIVNNLGLSRDLLLGRSYPVDRLLGRLRHKARLALLKLSRRI